MGKKGGERESLEDLIGRIECISAKCGEAHCLNDPNLESGELAGLGSFGSLSQWIRICMDSSALLCLK